MNTKVVKLKERRRKKLDNIKTYKRKRLIVLAIIVAVITTGAWLIYSSNFFRVTEIRVVGNKNISDQKIIEGSEIMRNESLFMLRSSKISSRLKKINWIESVKTVRDWPDTVILEINERQPIAYVETDKGSYLIDKKSFVVDKKINYQQNQHLAKVDGLTLENIKIGQHIKNRALDNALAAHRSLVEELNLDIYSITANSVDELYFIVQGIEIIYGEAVKTDLKNKVIKTMLKNKKENISTIDVRIPDKPVVRVLGG